MALDTIITKKPSILLKTFNMDMHNCHLDQMYYCFVMYLAGWGVTWAANMYVTL